MTESEQFAAAVRAGSLADRVASVLNKRIIDLKLPPGHRLGSEAELGQAFGVSRTVVREAVSRLKAEGLISSRNGLGVIVAEDQRGRPFRFDLGTGRLLEDSKYLLELRVPLEIEAAAIAAARRNEQDLVAMQAALDGMAAAVRDGTDGVDADVEFHRTITIATHNPHFFAFVNFMEPYIKKGIRLSRLNTALVPSLGLKVQAEHDRIFQAILRRQPKEAAKAASIHVRNTVKRLSTLTPDLVERESLADAPLRGEPGS
jgi:GntR family transcriptional repressor for pyruvate dehydrogenase complex